MLNETTFVLYRGGFVEDKLMLSCSFSCDHFHDSHSVNSVTLLCYLSLTWMFNKPTSVLCTGEFIEISSCLAGALGVTLFMTVMDSITLLCYLSPNLDVQQTGLGTKLAGSKIKIFKTKEQFEFWAGKAEINVSLLKLYIHFHQQV